MLNKNTVNSYINNLEKIKNLGHNCSSEAAKNLKHKLIQVGEDFQKCAENAIDDRLRNQIYHYDSSFLKDEKTKTRFLTYLFMQYFRTPMLRKSFTNNINNYIKSNNLTNCDGNKIWAATHGAISCGAANSMATKRINIKFLKTKDEVLVTSDCPVVRLKLAKDSTDRFYYPFSPTVAIIIGTNNDDSGIVELSKEAVIRFNNLTRNSSRRIIISKCHHR